jgi:nitroreductase
MIRELVIKNRSYRRFFEEQAISTEELRELVDLARLSASARNLQPLKYVLINSAEQRQMVFSTLAWAGYLKDWPGPAEGERPAAYIVILNDKDISKEYFCDHGIASQSILLGAVEKGYGGCIVASINRQKLREGLGLSERFEIIQLIALGKPKETVKVDEIGPDGDIKYWRDEDQVHHVPKRALSDIILDL